MNSYPVFLQLKDFRCLVVGGGNVALRKIKGLLSAGALPQIIAPEVNAELFLLIEMNNLIWVRRKFEKDDTQGFQLIIAATNDMETNAAIRLEASAAHLLVNDVTNPEESNFHVPALVSRPPLMLAFGTSGEVPYLSHRLKAFFEAALQPDLGDDIERLKQCRTSIIERAGNDVKLKEQLIISELNPLVEDFLCGWINEEKHKLT
ncbi:MAG TPA: bifunctional precorrin-2 dehydrogenase/sirohydrochlorin ferrochelatase [Paludibacter sp.]|nr:bifunctional precorrin-2 dehydrogenase/sirohydrochlorin ferrochelatase [Paludibacter sp.]